MFCVRKVLSVAELRRMLIHWATIAMLLVVVGRLKVAAGTIGSVTRILIGIDAHIVFYNATGVILGPTAAKVAGEDTSISVCMGYKADGTLFNGLEWGVARTEGCMRYLTPVDGEHSCAAFAATKAHFKFDDLR